jgi:hypothetical protein
VVDIGRNSRPVAKCLIHMSCKNDHSVCRCTLYNGVCRQASVGRFRQKTASHRVTRIKTMDVHLDSRSNGQYGLLITRCQHNHFDFAGRSTQSQLHISSILETKRLGSTVLARSRQPNHSSIASRSTITKPTSMGSPIAIHTPQRLHEWRNCHSSSHSLCVMCLRWNHESSQLNWFGDE